MADTTLLRRLVARLDETGGLLLEMSAGAPENPRLTSCLDDNHRTLAEARKALAEREAAE